MRTRTILVLFLTSLAALGGLTAEARADRGRNPLAGQPAIRHRLELRKLRFEVSPQFLLSVNQPFLIGIGGGANVQFHITDWLGIAASFHYTANVASPLANQVEASLPSRPAPMNDPAYGLRQPSKDQFRDHLIGPNLLGGLYATLTPMGGKFSLFNALFANYDFYGLAGLGLVNLTTPVASGAGYMPPLDVNNDVNRQSPDIFTGPRVAGLLGIGVHIFFNDFLALQMELRDYIYKSNPGGLDVSATDSKRNQGPVLTSADEYVVNHLYFGLGLSIFLPPRAKVLDKRPDSPKYVPKSEPTPVAQSSRGKDRDGDGIEDRVDRCPDQPEDRDGFEDSDGCPDPDNDKDGVLDGEDACPNQAGVAENQGCPDKDQDGDGVADRTDQCPETPGVKPTGCPEEKRQYIVVTEDKIDLRQQIRFATGKATILPASFPLLDEVVSVLQQRPKLRLRIEGHTDNRGNPKKNQKLSEARAQAVVDYLVRKGIDPARLSSAGFGSSRPIADNRTAAGREKNRRTEFFIEK
ncbi:MAG: outer membrane beta-barrel domain-containing protein [Myxococcales bacterium]|nr:outer membrane beta-barrel domain-containing protein [Myxococcota bacterium]MDW8282379.1 outer membrane beta-barrel domain-containing protein [Myxococcales bacterium]